MNLFNNDSNMAGIFRAKLVKFNESNMKSKVYIPSIHTINPYEYEEGSQEWEDCLKLLPEAPWCVYKYDGKIKHEDGASCWIMFESGNIKYPIIMSYFMDIIVYTGSGSGGSTGGGGDISINNPDMTGVDTSNFEQYIWTYFKSALNNEYGTAGLMGNLNHESGLIPYRVQGDFSSGYATSLEYTSKVDSGEITKNDFIKKGPGGGGYGLAQWTWYTRKEDMYNYWKNGNYTSIGSIELACDFLLYELNKSYSSVVAALKSATSVKSASDVVLHQFEKPADQGTSVENIRAGAGQAIYNKYSGK